MRVRRESDPRKAIPSRTPRGNRHQSYRVSRKCLPRITPPQLDTQARVLQTATESQYRDRECRSLERGVVLGTWVS